MGEIVKANSTLTPTDHQKRKVVLIEEKPRFYMHLDADRDGTVDDNFQNLEKWVWGKAGRGAAILVNNNANTHSIPLDHEDGIIVSANFAAPCQRLRLLSRSGGGVIERQQIADIVTVGAAWQLG